MSSRSYTQRTSSESSDSSTSTTSSSYDTRYSMDNSSPAPRVEILRCSRCAKCVETITRGRVGDDLRRVSTDDASANGMVRFGHNLYYCDRCARMVGYKWGAYQDWTLQLMLHAGISDWWIRWWRGEGEFSNLRHQATILYTSLHETPKKSIRGSNLPQTQLTAKPTYHPKTKQQSARSPQAEINSSQASSGSRWNNIP